MLNYDTVMDSSHWTNYVYQKFWTERKRHCSTSWILDLSNIQTCGIYTCICWHILLSLQRHQYKVWTVKRSMLCYYAVTYGGTCNFQPFILLSCNINWLRINVNSVILFSLICLLILNQENECFSDIYLSLMQVFTQSYIIKHRLVCCSHQKNCSFNSWKYVLRLITEVQHSTLWYSLCYYLHSQVTFSFLYTDIPLTVLFSVFFMLSWCYTPALIPIWKNKTKKSKIHFAGTKSSGIICCWFVYCILSYCSMARSNVGLCSAPT
jgi:hypothetical protein